MTTPYIYLILVFALFVLYLLTRPPRGAKPTSWLSKFAGGVQGLRKTEPYQSQVLHQDPTEVAQVLEDIYQDFKSEVARLEGELRTTVAKLNEENEHQWGLVQAELANLRVLASFQSLSQTEFREHQFPGVPAPTLVNHKPASATLAADTLPSIPLPSINLEAELVSINSKAELESKHFAILDELVRGSDLRTICHRLGVEVQEVELIRQIMSQPGSTSLSRTSKE